jgi:hypothetical protein
MTTSRDPRRKAEIASLVDAVTAAMPEPWIDLKSLRSDGVALGKRETDGLVLLFQTEGGLVRWAPPKPKALYELAQKLLDRELAEFRKNGGVKWFMSECRAAMKPKRDGRAGRHA